MNKIAIAGTGSIGCLLGGYLAHAGHDVTMISAFRPESAAFLREHGLTIGDLPTHEDLFHTDIQAAFIDDLADERFDIIMLAVKFNDLDTTVPKLLPHLTQDGYFVTFENGINDDLLLPMVGAGRLVGGSTFAGGHLSEPGHMFSHEGFFVVGELDGTLTERVRALGALLECCRPTVVSDHVRAYQWEKMGRVCLSVPSACISGLFLGDVFMEPRLQKQFALLALEIFAVAEKDGCPMDSLENKSRDEWRDVAAGRLTGLEGRDASGWAPGIVDAYTADIRKGLPLEIGFTNGSVSRLGRKHGVPTPANDRIVELIRDIEAGRRAPGFELVEEVIRACEGA